MIRIFMEAKEDFDRIVDLCTRVMLKKIMKQEDDPTYQQSYDRLKNYYQNKIEQFKTNKNTVKAPYNDITYWYKEIKDKGYEASALFEQFVESMSRNTEDRKRFREIYPASLVRKFENGKYKLDLLDQFYYNWVKAVDDYGRDAKEMESTLRKLLIDRVGYSKEDIEEIENGTQEIMSYNDWDLYLITNYEAAEYYGQGTGWCISGNYSGHQNRGRIHFNNYIQDTDSHGFFFLIKGGNEEGAKKFCVFRDNEGVQIWEGTDGLDRQVHEIKEDVPSEIADYLFDLFSVTCSGALEGKEERQRAILKEYIRTDWHMCNILISSGFKINEFFVTLLYCYYDGNANNFFKEKLNDIIGRTRDDGILNQLYEDVLMFLGTTGESFWYNEDEFKEMLSIEDKKEILRSFVNDLAEFLSEDCDTGRDVFNYFSTLFCDGKSIFRSEVIRRILGELDITCDLFIDLIIKDNKGIEMIDYCKNYF